MLMSKLHYINKSKTHGESMDKIIVNGGKKLFGKVEVSSAKNACLPILAGIILCEGEIHLNNIPKFEDIDVMFEILKSLNIKVKKNTDKSITFSPKNQSGHVMRKHFTEKIRSSIFCLGPLLARQRKAIVSQPGGCAIGERPIDLHLNGLRKLGAIIEETPEGLIVCDGKDMKGEDVHLSFPSVGATENIMMAAVLIKGTTRIFNSAKEPEIVDLARFLNKMGAKISGAGSEVIEIKGVKKLGGGSYTPIPDRIITGTLMIAPLITGGKVFLDNVLPEHVESIIEILNKTSCKVDVISGKIIVEATKRPKAFGSLETMPYPLFPTDLQPQMLALATVCNGTSHIKENLFSARFKHIPHLVKMGANITLENATATVKGIKQLKGTVVKADDLRGGACLVMAGLGARGTTVVEDVFHIDRGYESIESIFANLGADIVRVWG
jgi:UDP-N-acetylglucosamine 1-carboxyvinyltransferase